jgi:hypothetical protein
VPNGELLGGVTTEPQLPPDEHVRYLMLTRAALECCQRMGFAPEIVAAFSRG